MTTFETEEDIRREKKAINTFVNVFGGSFQKLGTQDVDYKIFDKDKALIAYAEVKGVIRNIRNAYPLPMTIGKLSKLMDKRLNPVIIWCCDDGIIYANPTLLTGIVKFDNELIVYYDKQRPMKYVRFQ
jgi:hypothetical protein